MLCRNTWLWNAFRPPLRNDTSVVSPHVRQHGDTHSDRHQADDSDLPAAPCVPITTLAAPTMVNDISTLSSNPPKTVAQSVTPPPRMVRLDQIKAIAICLVILLHSAAFLQQAVPQFSAVWYLMVTLNAACRMAVPLFVMISGAVLMLQWQHALYPHRLAQLDHIHHTPDANHATHVLRQSSGADKTLFKNMFKRMYRIMPNPVLGSMSIAMYKVVFSRLQQLVLPLLFATLFYSAWQGLKVDIQHVLAARNATSAVDAFGIWTMLLQQFSVTLPSAMVDALIQLPTAGGSYYHLWYLWLYIGLLLISPWVGAALYRPQQWLSSQVPASMHTATPPVAAELNPSYHPKRRIVFCYGFSLCYLSVMLTYPMIAMVLRDGIWRHQLLTQLQDYSWLTDMPWWWWWPAFLGFFIHGMLSGQTLADISTTTLAKRTGNQAIVDVQSELTPSVHAMRSHRFGAAACRFLRNIKLPVCILLGCAGISLGYIFEVWWQTQHGWFIGYSFHYSALGVTIVTVLTWRFLTRQWLGRKLAGKLAGKTPYQTRQQAQSWSQHLIAWLARHSLGIYLCHVIFLEIWQQLWVWLDKPGMHHLLLMGLVVICHAFLTLCCSVGFIWLVRYLLRLCRALVKKTYA